MSRRCVNDPLSLYSQTNTHLHSKKELLDPAIIGTTGVLKSIKKSAPTVKRVVITSSFASIINPFKGTWPGHTYSEADWNPLTPEQAVENPANGYRASKTFAERAAWDFVEREKPNFTLATMCPPLVLGPIVHYLNSLDGLNTSNQRIRDIMLGKAKEEIPPTGTFLWVDVRDLAQCHVAAIEKEAAADKRFFITAGYFSNKEIAQIVGKHYPQYKEGLPTEKTPGGDYPEEGVYKFDMSRRTRSANAALTGLGNTRRIILGDTLIDEFTPDEIETVLAHELGHHVNRDIPLSILVETLSTVLGLFLASLALKWGVNQFGLQGTGDIAGLPLFLLVMGPIERVGEESDRPASYNNQEKEDGIKAM